MRIKNQRSRKEMGAADVRKEETRERIRIDISKSPVTNAPISSYGPRCIMRYTSENVIPLFVVPCTSNSILFVLSASLSIFGAITALRLPKELPPGILRQYTSFVLMLIRIVNNWADGTFHSAVQTRIELESIFVPEGKVNSKDLSISPPTPGSL
jgi:hypothetical protein